MGPWLCQQDALAEGATLGFDPQAQGRDTLFLVRHHGVVRAWRNACPHIPGAPMAWRRHAYLSGDGQHLMCHAHGARFEIDTGRCVLGPCLGLSLTPLALVITPAGGIHLAAPFPEETTP